MCTGIYTCVTVSDSKQQATKAKSNPEFQVQSIGYRTTINNGRSKHQQYGERVRKLMQSNYSQLHRGELLHALNMFFLGYYKRYQHLWNVMRSCHFVSVCLCMCVHVYTYVCVCLYFWSLCVHAYVCTSLCVSVSVCAYLKEWEKERKGESASTQKRHTHTYRRNMYTTI